MSASKDRTKPPKDSDETTSEESTEKKEKKESPGDIHMGHRKRMRERFRVSGLDDFAPHEVLELLLTYCIPRVDVNEQAHALLTRFGSVSAVMDASIEELQTVKGIGAETALFLTMLPAAFRRYMLDKSELGEPMDTMDKIGSYLHALYTGITHERVYLLLFDNAMRLIESINVADGSINCVRVTVRRLAEDALFKHAACVVLAHNHPSGVTIPSGDDCEISDTLSGAMDLLGIPLVEHMIVTENGYAPILRHRRGLMRSSPMSADADEGFYRRFYCEDGTSKS